MTEFESSKICKARKQHVCGLCYELITVGSDYKRERGKNNGDFYDSKFCLRCDGLITEYYAETLTCGGFHEFRIEDVQDWATDNKKW